LVYYFEGFGEVVVGFVWKVDDDVCG